MRVRVTAAPVRSYRTLSPLPVRDSRVAAPSAVCSLWHFPAGFPGWALPTAVPCGVRTFLEDSFRHLRDCLTRTDKGTREGRLRRSRFAQFPAGKGASGELGPAGFAARGRQLSMTHRALRPAASHQGLPGAEDRFFKRHLGRLEQSGLFFDRKDGHETLLNIPTTRPRMRASRVRIGFMLLFSGCSRT